MGIAGIFVSRYGTTVSQYASRYIANNESIMVEHWLVLTIDNGQRLVKDMDHVSLMYVSNEPNKANN